MDAVVKSPAERILAYIEEATGYRLNKDRIEEILHEHMDVAAELRHIRQQLGQMQGEDRTRHAELEVANSSLLYENKGLLEAAHQLSHSLIKAKEDKCPAQYSRPGVQQVTVLDTRLSEGLENCRLFAARNAKEDWARTILGFCNEAGVTGSPLRSHWGPVYRNKKHGSLYVVTGEAINCTNAQDGQKLKLYRSQDGQKYAREVAEFFEKFEPVTGIEP